MRLIACFIYSMVIISLSACSVGTYRGQVNKEHYLLDEGKGKICLESHSRCYSLSLIGPSHRELIIAKAYGLPNKAYRWDGKVLSQLLLNPPSGQYQPQLVKERLYRLPPHYAVHSVWDVLAFEYYELYEKGDDLQFPPTPRRY